MRQPTPTLPVTSKMLRHFAVVTVAITACIGIFAQGENTQVAAKPAQAQAAAPESGGGFLDFGGAERAALAGGSKGPQEVNGIKLASGTRLNTGGDDGGGGGGDGGGGGSGEGSGYIQNAPPAMRTSSDDPALRLTASAVRSGFSPPAGPPPIPRDGNGVPAPGAAAGAVNPAQAGKPQPPRKASQQDIERMMAASSQRSGRATTD
jgi:hypothetical protein